MSPVKERSAVRRMVVVATASIVFSIVVFGLQPAMAQFPAGDQFLVNEHSAGVQNKPSLAMGQDGSFIVVWRSSVSYGSDHDLDSIQGRRFAADGVPLASQFQVNTYTTNRQRRPSVAMAHDGTFVVVWHSNGADTGDSSGYSIQGQRFAADGVPIAGQFQVNTYTYSTQIDPVVSMRADGGFVVVWESARSDDDDGQDSILGQLFAADGAPLASQFLVNTHTLWSQVSPAVAMAPAGDFVVAWRSNGLENGDTAGTSVQGQRFAADGTPLASQFLVNTYTLDSQGDPSVAVDAEGAFVISWTSWGSYGSDAWWLSVQGQRFSNTGVPLASQFQANAYIARSQARSATAMASDGSFVVVWESELADNGDTSFESIQGQRFAHDGAPLGGQFLVNTYTTGPQMYSAAAMAPDGAFVVAWYSSSSDNGDSSSSIQARRYDAVRFADGFESGDTTGWDANNG